MMKYLTLSLFLILVAGVSFAQPGGGGPGGGGPPVPISGIEVLIGAGALWGAKKVRDYRKAK